MASNSKTNSLELTVLLLSVFVVGLCTIVFELLIGAVSSYFLGDSVRQFSLTIGLTMSAMGLGTLLSRLVHHNLIAWFVGVEIVLGLVGGFSVPLLFAAYTTAQLYYPVMFLLIGIIGTLIGLEIPLLTRIMDKQYSLRLNISNVLSLDYFGALAATLLFPFCMLPFLGIFKSSLITGMANVLVGILNLFVFRRYLPVALKKHLRNVIVVVAVLLVSSMVGAGRLTHAWESLMYEDHVIFSSQSQYQKIILTRSKDDVRLFLDGSLQFSSIDEYRYHESLIHIPMGIIPFHKNILVLGGGDGLGIREILKYSDSVESITVVDLDPEITNLARQQPLLRQLNGDAFANKLVQVHNSDAFQFLEKTPLFYDLIIADLPDPKNSSLARLYSKEFYRLVQKRLAANGLFITQATSPFFAPEAFWSIGKSLQAAGFEHVVPFHTHVPSFGDWGFVMASSLPIENRSIDISVPVRYLDPQLVASMFIFPKDLYREGVQASSLDSPMVLKYYQQGWKYWN